MGKICNISKGNLVSIMTMNKTHHHLQARSIEVSFNRLSLLKPGFHIFIQHFLLKMKFCIDVIPIFCYYTSKDEVFNKNIKELKK